MPPMSLAAMMPLQGPLCQVVSVLTNHPSLVCEALLCIFSSPLDRMNTLREFNQRIVCTHLLGKIHSRDSSFPGKNDQPAESSARPIPSKTSTGTSCTNCSHHLLYMGLEVHSCISNLHKRPARYITATAMISGSHCSDKVVQRLVQQEKEVT